MPKKGENTKKVAGNAKKAEAAAQKAAVESSKKAAVEDAEWAKGSKSNAKKEEAESRKAEAARKRAEKDALLAAEERSLPTTGGPKNSKTAVKKTSAAPARRSGGGTLNLDQLDDDAPEASSQPLSTLNATGIDNALDALSLTTTQPGSSEKIDRHPERRYKAAYAAYEARRMPELEVEMKGLRRQQRVDVIRKEFERSGENPFNQVSVGFDASREEVREVRERERVKVEERLGGG